jgi:hypothetical protein
MPQRTAIAFTETVQREAAQFTIQNIMLAADEFDVRGFRDKFVTCPTPYRRCTGRARASHTPGALLSLHREVDEYQYA